MKISRVNIFVMCVLFMFYYYIDYLFLHFFMEYTVIFIVQLILVLFTFSPFGSLLMRLIYECQPVQTEQDIIRLKPIYEEVYSSAKVKYRNMNPNICLYIDNSKEVNAYAFGSDTVVITRGAMLQLSDEQIKGVISHELGHIIHGDTFISCFLLLGNIIFLAVIGLFELVKVFFQLVANTLEDEYMKPRFINILVGSMVTICLLVVQVLTMILSRFNEYQADVFAMHIGYGDNIISALYFLSLLQIGTKLSLFERIRNSHPNIYSRISALESQRRILERSSTL